MRRFYTFHINSAARVAGTVGDYWVNIPQFDALSISGKKPDFYEVDLERIVSSRTMTSPGYFVQIAMDLPATQTFSNGANGVMFLIPVVNMDGGYVISTPSTHSNPVLVAASGFSTLLHIQILSSTGAAGANIPEHAFTLTIKEAGI